MSPLPRGGGDPEIEVEPNPRQLAGLIPRTQEGTGHRDDVIDCPHCIREQTLNDHASIQRALRARRARQEGTPTP